MSAVASRQSGITTAAELATPGDGQLAQRGLFAGSVDAVNKDLYARVMKGCATRWREGVSLSPGTVVSGNTYFARFPASYWQRWTDIDEVRVELVATGSGRLAIQASDLGGFARTVSSRVVEEGHREHVTLTARLDRFLDGGALWLDIETEAGQHLTVEETRWIVRAPEVHRTTSASFATMNRPEYCMGVLRALVSDPLALERLRYVYVVDQGTDLVESQEGFREAAEAMGEKLRYTRQPNLGGAGGCNRGLYDMVSGQWGQAANVLTLDDDIMLEPELVIRITTFGDHVAQPIIVGGQMLNIFHPTVLIADAQRTDIDDLQPGLPMPHSRDNVDILGPEIEPGRPNLLERRLDAGYAAWWACLIPMEVVEKIGYIAPIFTQADDAEYCYRARAHNIPTIMLPGAGLWHTDFALKDFDSDKIYFYRRNYLILAALHGEFALGRLVRKLSAELMRCLLGMQYGLAAMLLRALSDFLDGPDILADGGASVLRDIQALRAPYAETVCHRATALPGVAPSDLSIVNCGAPPKRRAAFALRRAVGQVRGRYRYQLGEVPHDEAHWWHVCLFRTAVVTDASQQGMRVRSLDRAKLLTLAHQGAGTMLRLLRTGTRVKARYRKEFPVHCGRENWTRLYGLE